MAGEHERAHVAQGPLSRDLSALRKEYGDAGLDEARAPDDPWPLWQQWYDAAAAAGLHEPNAMVVATADATGTPSVRTVLLKGAAEEGFRFFTNTTSRKGSELADRPACALLFAWHALERQVRVQGIADRLSDTEVAAYFASRPRGSQLGAWASLQSQVVSDRAALSAAYAEVAARFEGKAVPVPPGWGGYLVRPVSYEFWQGRPGRMHDRLLYARTPSGWAMTRLAP